MADEANTSQSSLDRSVGVPGAVMLGLGSILGTGVFVSLGMATSLAGPWVLIAIGVALVIALCNGLSSAQLAAAHPVSGGTYEYASRLISPGLGFTAGWLFLSAKSASAASAALGAAVYLMGTDGAADRSVVVVTALGIVALTTLLVLSGLRRSNLVNTIIVSFVFVGLIVFLFTAFRSVSDVDRITLASPRPSGIPEAVAIVFVAFTGYGRVATLGEEIRNPRRSIPRAVIATLLVAGTLYLLVGAALAFAAPASQLVSSNAAISPLEVVASHHGGRTVGTVVAICAVTAMIGVLINLLLGLSRVMLAMGRRGDMPAATAMVGQSSRTPIWSVLSVGCITAGLVLIGDLAFTWTLSALMVLGYYAITNLTALRLRDEERRFPQWTAWSGCILCLAAACSLPAAIWWTGTIVLAAGFGWRFGIRFLKGRTNGSRDEK